MAEKQMTATEILLGSPKRTTKYEEFKLSTVSKEIGKDFNIKIKNSGYDGAALARKHIGEEDVYLLMEGLVEPNVKNKDLQMHYEVETPVDLIKKLFMPGEITNIARRIDVLSGYYYGVIEEIKKNSESEAIAN